MYQKTTSDAAMAAVLIPAHNEAAHIVAVVKGAKRFVRQVLVVDDGSVDDTGGAAAKAGAEVIRHPVNQGKGAALQSGFKALLEGGAGSVIVMDGDGQHDPEEIQSFLKVARQGGADIILGNRMETASAMPLVRYYTNLTMSRILSWLCRQKIPDSQCGYRLITREVLGLISFTTSNYDTESEMLIEAARHGFTIRSVPVRTIYTGQTSKIHPARDTVRFISLVFRNLLYSK